MISRLFLFSIAIALFTSAYSPKSQFDKTNHSKTIQQEQEASPRSVIGGVMGGANEDEIIQREEADDETLNEYNCKEARQVCGSESRESSSVEP